MMTERVLTAFSLLLLNIHSKNITINGKPKNTLATILVLVSKTAKDTDSGKAMIIKQQMSNFSVNPRIPDLNITLSNAVIDEIIINDFCGMFNEPLI
ncbi:hypothetical protein GGER_10390 [Serratia rubidaea]